MNRLLLAISVSVGMLITGCAFMPSSSPTEHEENPGFLENYSILRPVPSESGIKAWRYINPQFTHHEYTSVIVQKVTIYENSGQNEISQSTIDNSKKFVSDFTKQHLQEHQFKIVSDTGPKVASVEMIVSGAEIEPKTWRLRKIIPVSDALAIAKGSKAKEDDSAIVLEIGTKAIDAQSGLLVGASFVSVPAEAFIDKSGNHNAFQDALKPWISLSLDNFVESR